MSTSKTAKHLHMAALTGRVSCNAVCTRTCGARVPTRRGGSDARPSSHGPASAVTLLFAPCRDRREFRRHATLFSAFTRNAAPSHRNRLVRSRSSQRADLSAAPGRSSSSGDNNNIPKL